MNFSLSCSASAARAQQNLSDLLLCDGVPAEVALSAMSLESAPQVEFDLHPDERIEIDDDDDVLRRELGI